jgi:dTMP kinase
MSKFLVIEGPDRCGKATQSNILCDYLKLTGKKAVVVEVPIKSNIIHGVIYWMLGNGLAKKFPRLFQWFQYFNRQIFQWTVLPRLEKSYDFIIMDRWSLSTVVYGEASGVSQEFTKKLYDRLKVPDCTIILLGQSHAHIAEDVYESDQKLQLSVRKIYKEWADQNIDKSQVINCNQTIEEVSRDLLNSLKVFGII